MHFMCSILIYSLRLPMIQTFFTLIHRSDIFYLTTSWALLALVNAACSTNHSPNFSPYHDSSPVWQKQLLYSVTILLPVSLVSGDFLLALWSEQFSAWPQSCQTGRCSGAGGSPFVSAGAFRQCLLVNGSWETPAASCPIVWEGPSVPSL